MYKNSAFFGSSTSSYLCFIWSENYFTAVTCNVLWSNPSFIYFSFNQNILFYHSLLLFLQHFFHTIFCLYQPYLLVHHRDFRDFFMSCFDPLYSLNTLFIETNLSWVIYKKVKENWKLTIFLFLITNLKSLASLNKFDMFRSSIIYLYHFFTINESKVFCCFSAIKILSHYHLSLILLWN